MLYIYFIYYNKDNNLVLRPSLFINKNKIYFSSFNLKTFLVLILAFNLF